MRDRMAAVEAGYDELRNIVTSHMRRQTRRLEIILVMLVAGGGVFTYQQWQANDQADKIEAFSVLNRRSTFVGCVLLANALQQSGANRSQQTQGPARRNEAPSPQSRLSTRLVAKILSLMTPAERREIRELQREIETSGGGVITVPDCGDVVMHPERVRPIQIKP